VKTVAKYLRSFALLLGCSWILNGYGQDYPYLQATYPFINLKANHLIFPGDSTAFSALQRRMDELLFKGKGQINIVHVGGSHVQADMWTERMRRLFRHTYDGTKGPRGLVFPFRMAHTNGPQSYSVRSTGKWSVRKNVGPPSVGSLGLTGYALTTQDSACDIQVQFLPQSSYDFNRVKIFHDQDSSSFSMFVKENGLDLPLEHFPEKGYSQFKFSGHAQTLDLVVRRTDSTQRQFTLYGLVLENDDPGFVWHGVGVNGASTSSYLKCDLFKQHLAALNPDLIVFSVGINDANTLQFDGRSYERNYDTLVNWVRSVNPEVSILFTTNTDSYYRKKYPNKNAAEVRDIMIRLAKRHRAAVWDCWSVMGGLGSIKSWVKAGLANSDKVHMLAGGYELLGDLFFTAFWQHYDAHLKQFPDQSE
jgi:lysophospholipase L1-like esterase